MPDLTWLQKWTELVASANTVAELAKKLVHSNVNPGDGVGYHFYLLDSKGQINLVGGYGINPLEAKSFSAWDDQLLANAIRNMGIAHQTATFEGSALHCYAIPMLRADEPLGAAMFCQRQKIANFPKEANLAMGQVLGLWMQSTGITNGFKSNHSSEPNPESLTERQLKILEAMSLGKTNAEIAQEMILSESSIRQETVKIYRALGVSSRSEAAKRAIHLGILRAAAM